MAARAVQENLLGRLSHDLTRLASTASLSSGARASRLDS
jgi:hypothetical protein